MKTSVDCVDLVVCCILFILNQCSAELSVPIITIVSGSNLINESNILSLTCFTNTTQRTVVTWSRYGRYNIMEARPDGSVTISGVPYDRYRILSENNLRITANYADDGIYFQCQVSYPDLGTSSSLCDPWFLTVNYRPFITSLNPPSKQVILPVNGAVNLQVYYRSSAAGRGVTWTFRPSNVTSSLEDVKIVHQTAPHYFNVYLSSSSAQLSFTSRAGLLFTGNYTCRVYNIVGFTITVFQVLDPSPPDPPIGLVLNPTPISISVQWKAQGDNGRPQSFAIQFINLDTNATIGLQTSNYDPGYNITTSVRFSDNIHQLTTYKVRLWSYNSKGNSSVVEAVTRTPPMPVLSVSESSINISGSEATVNYSMSYLNSSNAGDYVNLEIVCCESPVSTTRCLLKSYRINSSSSSGQFAFPIPVGQAHYFQFRLSNKHSEIFSAFDLNAVKDKAVVPHDQNDPAICTSCSSSTGTVVALAVLLAVSLLTNVVLAVAWIGNRRKKTPRNSTKDETTPSQPNHTPHEIVNQNIYQNSGFVPSTNPTEDSSKPPQSITAPHEIVNQNIYHNSGFVPSTNPPEGSTTTAPVYMALENKQIIEAVYECLQGVSPLASEEQTKT